MVVSEISLAIVAFAKVKVNQCEYDNITTKMNGYGPDKMHKLHRLLVLKIFSILCFRYAEYDY